jgi:hypothetical protein
MSQPSFQTVQLSRGWHRTPGDGACVVELSSMLAGEPFTDRPGSVCPTIAAFLRCYNDLLPDGDRDELYPLAAAIVGSRASRTVARRRARALIAWIHEHEPSRRLQIVGMLAAREWIAAVAAEVALALEPARRRAEVSGLLDSLLAVDGEVREDGVPPPATILSRTPSSTP